MMLPSGGFPSRSFLQKGLLGQGPVHKWARVNSVHFTVCVQGLYLCIWIKRRYNMSVYCVQIVCTIYYVHVFACMIFILHCHLHLMVHRPSERDQVPYELDVDWFQWVCVPKGCVSKCTGLWAWWRSSWAELKAFISWYTVYQLMKTSVTETFWISFVQLRRHPAHKLVRLLTHHLGINTQQQVSTISLIAPSVCALYHAVHVGRPSHLLPLPHSLTVEQCCEGCCVVCVWMCQTVGMLSVIHTVVCSIQACGGRWGDWLSGSQWRGRAGDSVQCWVCQWLQARQ